MKRALIAVLIIVIASSSAFAAKGEIGGTLYPDAMISTSDGTTVLGVILMAEGANYFGAENTCNRQHIRPLWHCHCIVRSQ